MMVINAPYFLSWLHTLPLVRWLYFVAHNVKFGFEFLNNELEKAGLSALENRAIDTVVISRILFPQLKSYSLQALNESLDLGLIQAHDADMTPKQPLVC